MPSLLPVKSRASFDLSNTCFIASLFCVAVAEAFMIRGLWFRPVSGFHRHGGFDLPFLVWIPVSIAFLFLQVIRKRMRQGHITPRVASSLSSSLALLLLLTYLLIARFAQIAFR
jgi:hypothetical protein